MKVSSVCVFVFWIALVLYSFFTRNGGNTPPGPTGLPYVGYLPFLSPKPYLDFQRLARIYGPIFSVRLGTALLVVVDELESNKKIFFVNDPFTLIFNRTIEEDDDILGDDITCIHNEANFHRKLMGKKSYVWDMHFFMKYKSGNTISLKIGERWNNNNLKVIKRKEIIMKPNNISLNESEYTKVRRKTSFLQIKNGSKIWRPIDSFIMVNTKLSTNANLNKKYLKHNPKAHCNFFQRTLEWLLLMMAAQPNLQRRIYLELKDKNWTPLPTNIASQFNEVPYTTSFILEMIRWKTFFPLSNIFRTSGDAMIHGYFIPKHTFIVMNIWSEYHRREKWGEDFSDFNPRRFILENNETLLKPLDISINLDSWAKITKDCLFAKIFYAFLTILKNFLVTAPDRKLPVLEEKFNWCLTPQKQELRLIRRN